ncbi:Apc13p-domain-containing protein [Didymella exigua CBS 183.55]|uniref:Apc13p-domain-containing protein n=1 Tax=Didymella exigua CBS 183.55 TaxID=1150837 RepID=A0A6A5S1H7_9PLEO|nr:Apc13p-domain-containing protein [Didymella exigua CBS 183.55]KAF1933304.1 Apc13p-domain-containing protein [Didymella exigua CBS 183.55]
MLLSKQTRDSSATYLHMHASHHADLLELFTNLASSQLAPENIYVPPHLQPVNPEDEDDVVPDQHAAFGIQRATQARKEPTWRDLGLEELLRRGPRVAEGQVVGGDRGTVEKREEEPVITALRRQPGPQSGVMRSGGASRDVQGGGSAAGNGLPR